MPVIPRSVALLACVLCLAGCGDLASGPEPVWKTVHTPEELRRAVSDAAAAGRPSVVEVFATW